MMIAFVVDDNVQNIMMFRDALEMARFHVESVGDGLDALNWLELNPAPNLIMLDINLPHYDGKQIYTQLRNKDKYADCPIIIATANRYMADQVEAIKHPQDFIMMKPINLIEIQRIAVKIRRAHEEAPTVPQHASTESKD